MDMTLNPVLYLYSIIVFRRIIWILRLERIVGNLKIWGLCDMIFETER